MRKKQKRVILDTNLWISFLISGKHTALDKLLADDKLLILLSEELLMEFMDVVKRPKFQKIINEEDLNIVLLFFQSNAEFIGVSSVSDRCRDAKDNFLLALAEDGKADFLITGDNDLLVLEKHVKTNIVSFSQFIDLIG